MAFRLRRGGFKYLLCIFADNLEIILAALIGRRRFVRFEMDLGIFGICNIEGTGQIAEHGVDQIVVVRALFVHGLRIIGVANQGCDFGAGKLVRNEIVIRLVHRRCDEVRSFRWGFRQA